MAEHSDARRSRPADRELDAGRRLARISLHDPANRGSYGYARAYVLDREGSVIESPWISGAGPFVVWGGRGYLAGASPMVHLASGGLLAFDTIRVPMLPDSHDGVTRAVLGLLGSGRGRAIKGR